MQDVQSTLSDNHTSTCPFFATHSHSSVQLLVEMQRLSNRKFLFLDRDGVINHDPEGYVKRLEEFKLIDGVVDSISRVVRSGWIVNICTNQPAISEGLMSHRDLDEIHFYLRHKVEALGGCLAEISYCPHTHNDGCEFRKPLPGQLIAIAERFQMTDREIKEAWLVGDNIRDLRAGKAFGCNVALVKTGHGVACIEDGKVPDYALIFDHLPHFIKTLAPLS